MGFFSGVRRIVIVTLNIVFVIVSFALLVTGIVLKFFTNNPVTKHAEDQIKSSLTTLLNKTGNDFNVNLDNFSLNGVFGTAAICLIVIGACLLVVAFCGCFGACCKFQALLVIYVGILILLLLGEISFVIVLYASSAVKNMVRDELSVSLENYQGLLGTNVESLVWNGVMREYQCCGVVDYKDFDVAKNWYRWTYIGRTMTYYHLLTPIACCVDITTDAIIAYCASYPLDSARNNYMKGCFDSIWDRLFDNPLMLGIALSVAFIVQILLVVLTILMYKENKENKVGPAKQNLSRTRGRILWEPCEGWSHDLRNDKLSDFHLK